MLFSEKGGVSESKFQEIQFFGSNDHFWFVK